MQSSNNSEVPFEDYEPYRAADAPTCPQCHSSRVVVDVHGYPPAPPEDAEWFDAGVDVHGEWFFAEEIPWDEDEDDEPLEYYTYTTLSGEPAVPTSEVFVRDFFGSRSGVWWHLSGCVIEMPDDMFPYQCRECGHVWGYEPYDEEDE